MDARLQNAESRIAELHQSLNTAALEKSYEKALLQIRNIHEEERSRVLRVRIHLLEDDNDALQDQLAEADDNLEKLERAEGDLRDELVEAETQTQRMQNELKAKAREAESLKVELASLNNVTADSTKLLTEKLALSRELSNLKPEIEHLRSQVFLHQSLLSEKLALQRQLSSVQVELETERRALERAKTKDSKQNDQDAKLKEQLDELRKELAKEKVERQKKDRQAAKETADWEAQRTILDSKLEAFRSKLRTTKNQLKETQDELTAAQAAARQRTTTALANPRKRSIPRFDPDATIGTPGDLHPTKRNKRASSALPGDKSTFSITPFLNRTLSIAPDSPEGSPAACEDAASPKPPERGSSPGAILAGAPENDPPLPVTSKGLTKARPTKAGILKATTSQKTNSRAKPRKGASLSVLEKVAEEGNEENENEAEEEEQAPEEEADFSKRREKALIIEPKEAVPKKKHKLLSGNRERTLFDDDEADAPKETRRSLFGGPIGGLSMRGGRSLAIPRGSLRVGLGSAEFSPLKKERAAVS